MRILRTARWLLVALVVSLIPVASHAGVLISVAVAPPVLLTYDQPPCPQPGWMWIPGYWAYDYNNGGYYWVPGTWVPAPYEGALWTPGYWGFDAGVYLWHPGYWGPHVGYYGGINYGFGYFGIGFVGGEWRGHQFAYNTAVMRVNTAIIHNTYVNSGVIADHRVVDNHVAYAGGRGGVNHPPTPQERQYMSEKHTQATSSQQQHVQAAEQNKQMYFNNNHGHPPTVAQARPTMAPHNNTARPASEPGRAVNGPTYNENKGQGTNPLYEGHEQTARPNNATPQSRPQPEARPMPQQQNRPQPESRQAPQSRPQPEARPAPQQHQQPRAPQHEEQRRDDDKR